MNGLFSETDFSLNEKQLSLFEKYFEILVEYNEKFNLTAITEKSEVYKKHFTDSLVGTKFLTSGKLLDVGSGGGFPGIPLAIVRPDIYITLLDATEKKCEFLKTVVDKLELFNVNVICGRAEELAKEDLREKFDMCTARAVGRLNALSEYTLPFIKIGGKFICYKGNAEEELSDAENALKILGGTLETVYKKEFSFGTREIIVIKKTAKTPSVYPRSYSKIKKNPL